MAEDIDEVLLTEPLDEMIKTKIYLNFQALQRQSSMAYKFKGTFRFRTILRLFRTLYIRFYTNIYSTDMYLSINPETKKELDFYASDLMRIKTKQQMQQIVLKSAETLRNMNLTKMASEEIETRGFSTKK